MAMRPGLRPAGAPAAISPLEAAIHARAEDAVTVLWELGGPPDADEAHALRCLPETVDLPAALQLLNTVAGATASCPTPGQSAPALP
jgi:hypothetical protein